MAALGENPSCLLIRLCPPGPDGLHAVCAGMKTTVSEAEHPLLCEGTRRVKGDLALALMITYKDDQCKLKKVKQSFDSRRWATPLPSSCVVLFPQILDKLLDRESQTHKPQTLSSFYSSKPATGSQRSPSKHATGSHSGAGGAAGGVGKHGPSSSSSPAATLAAPASSSVVVLSADGAADLKPVQNSTPGEGSADSREHGKSPALLGGTLALTLKLTLTHLLAFHAALS